jgi:hypothetical protein
MEGSVLSFLKAEWKVSDTGSAQWASSFIWVIFLTEDKMVPVPCKSNGKDNKFDNNFLRIYRCKKKCI